MSLLYRRKLFFFMQMKTFFFNCISFFEQHKVVVCAILNIYTDEFLFSFSIIWFETSYLCSLCILLSLQLYVTTGSLDLFIFIATLIRLMCCTVSINLHWNVESRMPGLVHSIHLISSLTVKFHSSSGAGSKKNVCNWLQILW